MIKEEFAKVISDIRSDPSLALKESLRKYLTYEIEKERERIEVCEEEELKYLQGAIASLRQVKKIISNKGVA